MAIDLSKIYEIVYDRVSFAPDFAKSIYQSRIATAASVCHTEEERSAVIAAAEDISFSLERSGGTFSLTQTNAGNSLAVDLVDQGKPVPYTGGNNGIVTEIDGSTRPSNVPPQLLQNPQPLPQYAWSATHFVKEAYEILKTSIPDMFRSAVSASAGEIGREVVKPALISILQGG